MDDAQFAEIAEWISNAELAGQDEAAMVTAFCERLVAFGLPLARGRVSINTLHPVYAGRAYFWQPAKGETTTAYGPALEGEALDRWKRSPFSHMTDTGAATLRRRVTSESGAEFPFLGDLYAAGMTDYFAVIDRFGADAIMGTMDCVYSSWASDAPQGFTEHDMAVPRRLTPPPRARRQVGDARAHRQDPGRDLPRTRPRQAGAGRKHHARKIGIHRGGCFGSAICAATPASATGCCRTRSFLFSTTMRRR